MKDPYFLHFCSRNDKNNNNHNNTTNNHNEHKQKTTTTPTTPTTPTTTTTIATATTTTVHVTAAARLIDCLCCPALGSFLENAISRAHILSKHNAAVLLLLLCLLSRKLAPEACIERKLQLSFMRTTLVRGSPKLRQTSKAIRALFWSYPA